jgi:hypothetical protein
MIYPFLTIYNGLAALTGPAITGALYDRTGSYAAGLVLSAAVAGVGAVVVGRWKMGGEVSVSVDSVSGETAGGERAT